MQFDLQCYWHDRVIQEGGIAAWQARGESGEE